MIEVALWFGGINRSLVNVVCVLLLDLLILSPLKVGRALWYDTACTDPTGASLALFFRFFRFQYFKTILWRLQLWSRMLCWTVVYAFSLFLVRYVKTFFEAYGTALVLCDLVGHLLYVIAPIYLLYRYCYYRSACRLLLYTPTVREAFRQSKRLFEQSPELLIDPCLKLIKRLPLFLLFFPIAYVVSSFNLQQAKNVRCFLLGN